MDAFDLMSYVVAVNVCDRKKWFQLMTQLAERLMAVATPSTHTQKQ